MEILIGQKFGLLTVISRSDRCKQYIQKRMRGGQMVAFHRITSKRYWICRCHCGATSEVDGYHLLNGNTKSCGCLHKRKGKDSPFFKGCGEIPLNYFTQIKRGARGGGILNRKPKEFLVTIEYLWNQFLTQNKRCALTGLPLSFDGTSKENKFKETSKQTASLDRIDSSKGYIEGNIQWIHKDVNIMKNDLDSSKFFYYCKLINENRPPNN
jgi:hypothetical protein